MLLLNNIPLMRPFSFDNCARLEAIQTIDVLTKESSSLSKLTRSSSFVINADLYLSAFVSLNQPEM